MSTQQAQQQNAPKSSRISNTEWGLVIGAVLVIDFLQVVLDLFVIGIFVNRFIDIVVGMALPFYFWCRGVKIDSKKVITWVSSFIGEEIPMLDAAPLWTGDVLATMAWDKAEKKLSYPPI